MATGFGIHNFNGHATHYEEGVPGQHRSDIQGLPTPEIYGPDACGTPSTEPSTWLARSSTPSAATADYPYPAVAPPTPTAPSTCLKPSWPEAPAPTWPTAASAGA